MRKKPRAIICWTLAAVWLQTLPAARNQAWTTLVWKENPGDTVALVVKSDMRAWQEVWEVAANPEGVLRRLSIGGPGFFVRQGRQVPDVSADFLADAVAQGTFTRWLEQHAQALNGMSIVVGRGRGWIYDQDRVYMVLKLPPEPRTFKLVICWRDRRRPGGGSELHRCKGNEATQTMVNLNVGRGGEGERRQGSHLNIARQELT
jgi:hypothetical protein